MRTSWIKVVVLTAAASLLVAQAGSAQRLYDAERDAQAQAAKSKLAVLESGALFEKQLGNANVLIKSGFDAYFVVSQRRMRTGINRFNSWSEMESAVESRIKFLGKPDQFADEDLPGLSRDLGARMEQAKNALEALKFKAQKHADPSVQALLDRVGDVAALHAHADQILALLARQSAKDGPGESEADKARVASQASLAQLVATFEALGKVYADYSDRLDEIDKLKGQLADLRIALVKVALEQLKVEEAYYKNIGAIRARREQEEREIQYVVTQYQEGLKMLKRGPYNVPTVDGPQPIEQRKFRSMATRNDNNEAVSEGETIEETLDRIAGEPNLLYDSDNNGYFDDLNVPINRRKRLWNTLLVLHNAAAILARASTPSELAELRLDQEAHLYSIRRSAVLARTYEVTISTGIQRLALFHQGGLKPQEVAEFIHALAAVAIPPAILSK